jgi:tetratricopeptide (TPR) repeat protein
MSSTQPNSPSARIEGEVRRIRNLLAKARHEEALIAAQLLMEEVPDNRDVLYALAVSQRYLGRTVDALRTLQHMERLDPRYGRLFQERGHCHRARNDTNAALTAYAHAVRLNAVLHASWKALAELHRATGQPAAADAAARTAAHLASLPPPVLAAMGMLAEGEVHRAEQVVRQFLNTHGNHVEAMRLLAQIGVQRDVLDDAEFLLESVLVFAPDHHAARYDYAIVLSQRHKHAQAVAETRKLLAIDPTNRAFRTAYANACVGLGDHHEALKVFRDLLAETPEPADLHLSIAHALKTLGRREEAVESYRAAAAARVDFGDAYWSLANLKTYRFSDAELSQMRSLEGNESIALVDRYHLCFALGKAFEDDGDYATSFAYYERGNALKKSESRYSPDSLERSLRLQATLCTREFFDARQGVGCRNSDPIFIVGLPRAGSTLLEQILASHSQVEGTMELADIAKLVQQLNGREQQDSPPRYPSVLGELQAEQLQQLGEQYIADTRVFRTNKPFFIDKMPNNFRHIGLIHLILPNARIIDARRGAMACCFSNFKQLFAAGQEFTYSLDDIARYYRSYVEVMSHWDEALPGRILRVQHEDVVADLEGSVHRLLTFCGLEFEPGCIEFHRTQRSVRTASSEQVRQPIFKESLDQWRHFEAWLGPLKELLGEYVSR